MASSRWVSLSSRQRKPTGGAHRPYFFAAIYLLGLYTWWVSCGFYFGVGGGTAAPVQPEADPSLECHRMRVAYEVTPGRGWGKLSAALQARWKEVGCDETAASAPTTTMATSTPAAATIATAAT